MQDGSQFEEINGRLLVRAPAKINLSLLIAGKRADGFHELETLMAKISLFDEIIIEAGSSEGIELLCTGPQWAPAGQDNLVHRAAQLLFDRSGVRPSVRISLKKNIPAGSGLGSASSDAAATLMGLNRFFDLRVETQVLAELAAQLGSDIPFFLYGPLSLCRGRGEIIRELDPLFTFTAALFVPNISVSTARVYSNYRHNAVQFQQLQVKINDCIQKNRIDLVPRICANMLVESCFSLERELAELKKRIESAGVGPLCLSGSGSAMYCLLEDGDVLQLQEWPNILKHEIDCSCAIVRNIRW
jgi:4-diphosphocytidyl-2-C-methyl-D-erythritol kinase